MTHPAQRPSPWPLRCLHCSSPTNHPATFRLSPPFYLSPSVKITSPEPARQPLTPEPRICRRMKNHSTRKACYLGTSENDSKRSIAPVPRALEYHHLMSPMKLRGASLGTVSTRHIDTTGSCPWIRPCLRCCDAGTSVWNTKRTPRFGKRPVRRSTMFKITAYQ